MLPLSIILVGVEKITDLLSAMLPAILHVGIIALKPHGKVSTATELPKFKLLLQCKKARLLALVGIIKSALLPTVLTLLPAFPVQLKFPEEEKLVIVGPFIAVLLLSDPPYT